MALNEYDMMIEQLDIECKAGKASSCADETDVELSLVPSSINDATLWGIILIAWVVVAIPYYLRETIIPSSSGSKGEASFTKLALWWSIGLVLLLAAWKIGANSIIGAVILISYIFAVLVFKFTNKNKFNLAITTQRFSKKKRALISAAVLWFFTVQTWGYVFEWNKYFSLDEYVALHISPIFGGVLFSLCICWIRNAEK